MVFFDVHTKYDINNIDFGCQSGQVWKCDNQYIIIDDILNIKNYDIIKNKMFQACITSPPYNANEKDLYENSFNDNKSDYVDWQLKVINILNQLIKGYLNYNIMYNSNARSDYIDIVYKTIKETDFELIDTVIWKKNRGYYGDSYKYLFRRFEYIFMFNNDNHNAYKCKPKSNVLDIHNHSQNLQGFNASFPLELVYYFLDLTTEEHDLIIEPFAGTGTVLIACQHKKRVSYNIEINPNFVNIMLNRFFIETNIKPILV